jgi:hypothetical protein
MGIARSEASPKGMYRAKLVVSGPEKISSPAVAETERMNPKSVAHHGFHSNIISAAKASNGIPAPGLPRISVNNTTTAITDALTTLGCGVTRMTKASNAITAKTIRSALPAPHTAEIVTMKAVTIAQLAPETAVM